MAFGTPNSGPNIQTGKELQEIQTSEIGFQSIHGEDKIRLLPNPWPAESLPRPSSSLLAVASTRGLLAAAGPSELVLASTAAVRSAWLSSKIPSVKSIKPFNPDITIPVPRLSHVAFSSDDNVLVVVSEQQGGLAAYSAESLKGGQPKPAAEISTNNQALLALIPNPSAQSARFFAAITTNGELLMADLEAGRLLDGQDGAVLRRGVRCVSWSNMGRQLVAGLEDGSAVQMTPDGTVKAVIPRPPSLENDKHISTLSWLTNDEFLIIYSPNSNSDDVPQMSNYFIVSREAKTENYTFQTLPEICAAFGLNRSPACHFVSRLRKFGPHIEELLVLASTTSFDLGVVTKSDKPLSAEDPVSNEYALTVPTDDSRRAGLPLSQEDGDTSPVGFALDLSSTDTVVSPIPSDTEIALSDGPLPNVLVLNNEGLLSSWWLVYEESVRQKITYSGLTKASGPAAIQPQTVPPPVQNTSTASPGFGQAAFGQSGFTAAQQPSSQASATGFGSGSNSTFGASSALGGGKASWASTGFGEVKPPASSSGFGQSGFGSSTAMANPSPAFGSASSFGARPAFGQPALTPSANTFGGNQPAKAFGATGGGGGFSSFSGRGGFSSMTSNQPAAQTSFAGLGKQASPFEKPATPFGKTEQMSPFISQPSTSEPAGLPSSKFSISSSFKPDPASEKSEPRESGEGGLSLGGAFGDVLDQSSKAPPAQSKEQEMGEDPSPSLQPEASNSAYQKSPLSAVTPPSTLSQPKSTPAPPLAGLFGADTHHTTTPAATPSALSTTPKETPKPKPLPLPATSKDEPGPPQIKEEPPSEGSSPVLANIPEAPLPPDPMSKPRYASSSDRSKLSDDASQQPAPVPERTLDSPNSPQSGPADSKDNDFSSDFEGSAEDETQEISPIEEPEEHSERIQTSPESSFGRAAGDSQETSPAGGLFTKVTTSKPPKLFGEVSTGVVIPPPIPQESPRSPSPMRKTIRENLERHEPVRSASAPIHPHSIPGLERRRVELTKTAQASESLVGQGAPPKSPEPIGPEKPAEKLKPASNLEDDEDERFRAELNAPPAPSEHLEAFLLYQPNRSEDSGRSGIPGQIERMYRDINAMVDIVGINARSLSNYLLYQSDSEPYAEWPAILDSETPKDALNDEWFLQDINRLHQGDSVLQTRLERYRLHDVESKFEECGRLLDQDLGPLRVKIIALRKVLAASTDSELRRNAPLSAEQTSLQHDLRKSSTMVQSQLVLVEQILTTLRAKLTECRQTEGRGIHRKPTVETLTSTVAKITLMAEKKSTAIDLLEADMKKLGIAGLERGSVSRSGSPEPNGTPQRLTNGHSTRTPRSTAVSVYHTPQSKFGGSTRSTPGSFRRSLRDSVTRSGSLVDTEDAEQRAAKAKSKMMKNDLLREVLAERRKKAIAAGR